MCGIIGFVDKKKQLSQKQKSEIALKMLKMIEYRGRDDSGLCTDELTVCGHNRLAIIDPSSGIHQPLSNTEGTLVMCYNGEIYNHANLRLQTPNHRYRSASDTETFLHFYEALRDRSFGLIRGMFAASFIDRETSTVTLAVDQYGIKPLYYLDTPDWFAWSSELKVFSLLPQFQFSLNEGRLFEYGTFRTTAGRDTLLKHIYRVCPGEIVRYRAREDELRTDSYPVNAEVGEIEDLLSSSVSEHLLSDMPVGLQLSGGVDSSLISVLAASSTKQDQIHSFSIGLTDPKWNEFEFSRAVAKQIRSIHHEVTISEADFCEALPLATRHLDEPVSHPNTVAMMILSREARKYVKVLLSGEGADEIFGGYSRYSALIQDELDPRKLLYSNSYIDREEVLRSFTADIDVDLSSRIRVVDRSGSLSSVRKLASYDIATFLPSLLLRQDKMGMSANLENRFPFLDPRLVASALKIPDEQKCTSVQTKIALKSIAAGYLAEHIVYRKKCGFGLPVGEWLRNGYGLGKYLNLLMNPKSKRSYLNYAHIRALIEEHLSAQKDNSEVLWILLNLEIWHLIFIDGRAPESIWSGI